MNAGAYGGEMKDIVKSAKVLDTKGEIITLSPEELEFGYRTSVIQSRAYIVLEVEMEFEKGNYEEIVAITKDLTEKRTAKQPLNLPSCGSVFKRPLWTFCGEIDRRQRFKRKKNGRSTSIRTSLRIYCKH